MTQGQWYRLRPLGPAGLLVELDEPGMRRRLHQALLADPVEDVVELVPAQHTVAVQCRDEAALERAASHIERLLVTGLDEADRTASEPVTIEVRYDGADLAEVARIVGISPAEVVARHTGQLWTVEFAGFMPGFGYLSGESGGLTVPRHETPRTRIPAGSVALAGDLTGIYPQASPGGWQLVGTTDARLWDVERQPPALLVPGARIRFEAV
ncbi:allophanate hydrolase subunit 1 [Luteococcus peritonei]|uniref:Allophanate hydrolase subunit 1 n=1 Tax=Luteococcus peritonei TaxID=88874 RepID=A0ABW4RYB1_9ACTN